MRTVQWRVGAGRRRRSATWVCHNQDSPVMRGTESLLSEGPFLYESVATVVI